MAVGGAARCRRDAGRIRHRAEVAAGTTALVLPRAVRADHSGPRARPRDRRRGGGVSGREDRRRDGSVTRLLPALRCERPDQPLAARRPDDGAPAPASPIDPPPAMDPDGGRPGRERSDLLRPPTLLWTAAGRSGASPACV